MKYDILTLVGENCITMEDGERVYDLYWISYNRARSKPYQISDYPAYIKKAISVKARLPRCGLSLTELAHLIEKTEREIFIRSHLAVNTKEYRHNYPSERNHVVAEIQAAWGQVKTMALPIDVLVNELTTDTALTRFAFSLRTSSRLDAGLSLGTLAPSLRDRDR
jgi:hypothetical protein